MKVVTMRLMDQLMRTTLMMLMMIKTQSDCVPHCPVLVSVLVCSFSQCANGRVSHSPMHVYVRRVVSMPKLDRTRGCLSACVSRVPHHALKDVSES